METLARLAAEAAAEAATQFTTELQGANGLGHAMYNWSRKLKPTHPPLVSLPCASIVSHTPCEKPGTKECQSAHWKRHKLHCKDDLLSSRWDPIWKARGYKPSFSAGNDLARGNFKLWGSMPPMDIVNLGMNENDMEKDLTVAFIDSGDLRNVVKTINTLPESYTGKVEVLVNDSDPFVATRNLAQLLVLGDHPADDLAVEGVLHYWVSAVLPLSHSAIHNYSFYPVRKEGGSRLTFGDTNSSVDIGLSHDANRRHEEWFPGFEPCHDYLTGSESKVLDVMASIVRSATIKEAMTVDDQDRVYAQVAPPHRVALKKYQETGVVLPFGSARNPIMGPNLYLFNLTDSSWAPPRGTNPLHGWDLREVTKHGATSGAQPEDIYGCLYFYLADQLREFRRRIRGKYSISFHVTSLPAGKLATAITHHRPSMQFDRIDVGRTLEHDKAGLKHTVQTWAPFLAPQKDAAITGYCKTWVDLQPDGKVKGAGDESFRDAMKKAVANMKSDKPEDEVLARMAGNESLFFSVCHNIEMGYDNSKAFTKYLASQGLDEALSHTGLKLRDSRRIVPHRLGVPLEASGSAIPEFENEEAWYHATMMNSFSWSERFLELGRE